VIEEGLDVSGVRVWADMWNEGIMGPYFIEGILTVNHYMDFCKPL
jgi:hypothetical protein